MSKLFLSITIIAISVISIASSPVEQAERREQRVRLEEQGGFFEGDMNLDSQQLRNIFTNAQAGLLDTRRRWFRDPNTGFVTVPFTVRRDAPYSE